MNDLVKKDIETLLQTICLYESGKPSEVDGELVDVIAVKYGLTFVKEKDNSNIYVQDII